MLPAVLQVQSIAVRGSLSLQRERPLLSNLMGIGTGLPKRATRRVTELSERVTGLNGGMVALSERVTDLARNIVELTQRSTLVQKDLADLKSEVAVIKSIIMWVVSAFVRTQLMPALLNKFGL
jgi:hypothetical protein